MPVYISVTAALLSSSLTTQNRSYSAPGVHETHDQSLAYEINMSLAAFLFKRGQQSAQVRQTLRTGYETLAFD